jgi:integrase/recombinase XerD
MTSDLETVSGTVQKPPTGIRRWLTDTERLGLSESRAARLALSRAIGADSPAVGPVETWLAAIDSDNTRAAYAGDVRAFVEWLRDHHGIDADTAPVNLFAVTLDTAARYADAMREMTGRYGKPLSASTRARRLSALSALYRHLTSRGFVPANPIRELERPNVPKEGRTPARAADEIGQMLEAADGLRDLVLVLLLFVSAFRVTEVCRANAENLSEELGRRLLAVRTKGGKVRVDPLDPIVADAIDLYLGGRTAGPLLLNDEGGRLERHHVTPILQRLARAAGIADPNAIRPHVMRTSAATYWLESGVPIQKVQHKLDHASSTTTEAYHRRSRGRVDDAALAAKLVAELPVDVALGRLRESRPA